MAIGARTSQFRMNPAASGAKVPVSWPAITVTARLAASRDVFIVNS
jgi:hypothetical protein